MEKPNNKRQRDEKSRNIRSRLSQLDSGKPYKLRQYQNRRNEKDSASQSGKEAGGSALPNTLKEHIGA